MLKRRAAIVVLALACLAAACTPPPPTPAALAPAQPLVTDIMFTGAPGTAAPPVTLGPFTMTPFGPDGRPILGVVTSVPGPAGAIGFAPSVEHDRIGNGWGTWSHGYTGDVYWTQGAQLVTLTMPPDTEAFYFYAEPEHFENFNVTAAAQDGSTSGPISVNGRGGAKYFGFYGTNGAMLSSIVVSSADTFALGEFGIAVQAPEADHDPVCAGVTGGPDFWPPDHRMVPVSLAGATDSDGDTLAWTVTGVTQDEPTDGLGDGDAARDALLLSGNMLQLRAERGGLGDGRVYRIAFSVSDGRGGHCDGVARVGVAHDEGGVPVDSALVFSSL